MGMFFRNIKKHRYNALVKYAIQQGLRGISHPLHTDFYIFSRADKLFGRGTVHEMKKAFLFFVDLSHPVKLLANAVIFRSKQW
jgi:hypothetical protein